MAKPKPAPTPPAALLPEPIVSPTDALQRPAVAAAYVDLEQQLRELAELMRHLEHAPPSAAAPAVARDALKRIQAIAASITTAKV